MRDIIANMFGTGENIVFILLSVLIISGAVLMISHTRLVQMVVSLAFVFLPGGAAVRRGPAAPEDSVEITARPLGRLLRGAFAVSRTYRSEGAGPEATRGDVAKITLEAVQAGRRGGR